MDLDLEPYAIVTAELGAARHPRSEILARHGLDEGAWEAIDARWQARLSEAMNEEGDEVPALVTAYSRACAAAQQAATPLISLEQFAVATRLLHASGDVTSALAKVGISFAAYVRGSEHWSRRLATDPDLRRSFQESLHAR